MRINSLFGELLSGVDCTDLVIRGRILIDGDEGQRRRLLDAGLDGEVENLGLDSGVAGVPPDAVHGVGPLLDVVAMKPRWLSDYDDLCKIMKDLYLFYKVTHHVRQNLLLTSKQKFRFGHARP